MLELRLFAYFIACQGSIYDAPSLFLSLSLFLDPPTQHDLHQPYVSCEFNHRNPYFKLNAFQGLALCKAGHESGSSTGTHEYTRGNTRG